jgi:hypothetical protein
VLIFAAVLIALVGAGAFGAVLWWRSNFRRLFAARFLVQDDASYIVHWMHGRGQPVEIYRIDAVTKDRAVASLIRGSVASTGLFVVLIIATIVLNVLRPTPLMVPALLVLGIAASLPQRRASLQASRLIVTGIRLDYTEDARPPQSSQEATARSLRLIILVSCAAAVIGAAVSVILALDSDRGASAWTDSNSLMLILILVVLPIFVAMFNGWALHRLRSQR